MRSVPTIDGAEFLGHVEPDEFLMRIARSRGYAAGAEGQSPNPAYPRDSAPYAAYMAAWERARSINETRPVVPKSSLAKPAPAALPPEADDFQLVKEPADDGGADVRRSLGTNDSSAEGTLHRQHDIAGEANDLSNDRSGPNRDCVVPVPVHGEAKLQRSQLSNRTGHAGGPLTPCGLVVVVDFLNVLVRSFHASPLSRINGVRVMLDTLAGVIERLSPEFLVFALDGGYAHRKRLYPDYKAHRGEKPPGLAEQMQLGEEVLDMLGWPAIRVVDWEADDVIASLATQLDQVATGVIVISSDKDLTQLLATTSARISEPWGKGSFTTEATCREKFGVRSTQLGDYLALVGDASDGVPGVRGIGPKKAAELLSFYGTLDKVLEAARCLMIPGAAGKNLREQTDIARLSRELVTLRADLPIGQHWQEWPLCEPRAGWQERLREAGLFGPAQRLKECLIKIQAGQGGKPKDLVEFASDDPSVLEIEWCQMNAPLTLGEFMKPVSGTASPEPAMVAAKDPPSTPPPEAASPADLAGAPAASPVPPVPDPQTPPVDDQDVSSWYPALHACPADASLLDKLRAIYRTGLSHRSAGRNVRNSWNRDTAHYEAFQAGLVGEPFNVNLSGYDAAGNWIDKPTRPLAEQPAVASQLF